MLKEKLDIMKNRLNDAYMNFEKNYKYCRILANYYYPQWGIYL